MSSRDCLVRARAALPLQRGAARPRGRTTAALPTACLQVPPDDVVRSAVGHVWAEHSTSVAPRKLTRIAQILHGEGRRALLVSSDDEISSD